MLSALHSASLSLELFYTTQLSKYLQTSSPPALSNLVCSHLALGGLVGLQALIERPLNGLHLGGNGLERLLIMLLPLQSLIQTLLLLADLWQERKESKIELSDGIYLVIRGRSVL